MVPGRHRRRRADGGRAHARAASSTARRARSSASGWRRRCGWCACRACSTARDEASTSSAGSRRDLDEEFRRSGFVNLGEAGFGFDIVFSREPVRTLADLERGRFWVWSLDPVMQATHARAGLKPVPRPVEEAGARLRRRAPRRASSPMPAAALAYQWSTQARYFTPTADRVLARLHAWCRTAPSTRCRSRSSRRSAAAAAKFFVRFDDVNRAHRGGAARRAVRKAGPQACRRLAQALAGLPAGDGVGAHPPRRRSWCRGRWWSSVNRWLSDYRQVHASAGSGEARVLAARRTCGDLGGALGGAGAPPSRWCCAWARSRPRAPRWARELKAFGRDVSGADPRRGRQSSGTSAASPATSAGRRSHRTAISSTALPRAGCCASGSRRSCAPTHVVAPSRRAEAIVRASTGSMPQIRRRVRAAPATSFSARAASGPTCCSRGSRCADSPSCKRVRACGSGTSTTRSALQMPALGDDSRCRLPIDDAARAYDDGQHRRLHRACRRRRWRFSGRRRRATSATCGWGS